MMASLITRRAVTSYRLKNGQEDPCSLRLLSGTTWCRRQDQTFPITRRAVTSYRLKWAGRSLFASVAVGNDLVSEAGPDVSLQKARSWDEGVSSNFSTTPLPEIFRGKKVVIFGLPHVPSYKTNISKFKAKGVDSVTCVPVYDPYSMNGWAEKLQAKDAIEFSADFDARFQKSLELTKDLSGALLVLRSERKVKVLNIEDAPSEFKVSGSEVILEQI